MIRFRVEWQDAPGVKDAVLARTWCRLAIEAHGRLVTEVLDNRSRSLRGGIYGSVFPLSQWIVENWWFLLNESYRFPAAYGSRDLARTPGDRAWIQRHSMLAARQGGALPDLTIYRDEESVVARWIPDRGDSTHPFLRFTGSGEVQMDPNEVKRELAELVDQVMDRLEGVEDTEVGLLREEWAGISASTEEDREICEWSARLGLDPHDPDEFTDDHAETIAALISPLEDSVRNDLLDAEQFESLQCDLEWLNQARSLAADAGGSSESSPTLSKVEGSTAHELGYYIDGPTMSGTTGPRAILVCDCRFGGDRLPRLPDIVLADLQAAEKAEQPVTGLVAAGVAGWRRCFGQCLLLHRQRRLQIDLGGLDRFVTEPQRDHRAIDACLKKVHGRRVAQAVDSDPLMFQRGASR